MIEVIKNTPHNVINRLEKYQVPPWGACEIRIGTARMFSKRKKKNVERRNRQTVFPMFTLEW